MTLEQYWNILIKHWRMIIGCFLVVGIGAYVGSKLLPPIYQATALVQVELQTANPADVNSLLASDQLVQTEASLAVSIPVLREVASHYKGLTPEALASEVIANPRVNTQLLEIDVQDTSPTRAAILANDIARTLIRQQTQSAQQNNAQAQQQIQTDLDNTQLQINQITSQIGPLQAQANALLASHLPGQPPDPPIVVQASALQTRVTFLQAQLTTLQQHFMERQTALAQLESIAAQNSNFLRLVQSAQPPAFSIRPQVYLNTSAGLLIGLLLGILLAVLLAQLDTRIRTLEALTQLMNWPLLATVRLADPEKEDLINPTHHTINAESYRILRTNVGFAAVNKPLRTIMVTSAVPNEGKSIIAANLAIFMAKSGKRTLLVDANLRLPILHELFHLSADKLGLSNAILAFSQSQPVTSSPLIPSLEAFIHSVEVPNLQLLPSGPLPPNPPDLFSSKAMERLFAAIVGCEAEIIILDSAPVLGLSDTSILAPMVDGTIVVVDLTKAYKKNLKQAEEILLQTGTHVLGCVANKQRSRKVDTTYSSYYYHTEKMELNGHNINGPVASSAPVQPVSASAEKAPHSTQAEQAPAVSDARSQPPSRETPASDTEQTHRLPSTKLDTHRSSR